MRKVVENCDVIISIKPHFVNMIRSGEKKYEFRKSIFRRPVNNIYIYESSPVMRIIGVFPFSRYLSGQPAEIWTQCSDHAGISIDFFTEYYAASSIAYAIRIDELKLFEQPADPKQIFENFYAPQSYLYITQGSLLNEKFRDLVQKK